jgi:hypothetical protein
VLAVGCPAHDHGVRHGEPIVLPTAGPAYAAARSALAEARNRHSARRHGHRRLDPVHRGVPGDVPRRKHPRHWSRGPRHPRARPEGGLHLPEFARAVLAEALLLQRIGGA